MCDYFDVTPSTEGRRGICKHMFLKVRMAIIVFIVMLLMVATAQDVMFPLMAAMTIGYDCGYQHGDQGKYADGD